MLPHADVSLSDGLLQRERPAARPSACECLVAQGRAKSGEVTIISGKLAGWSPQIGGGSAHRLDSTPEPRRAHEVPLGIGQAREVFQAMNDALHIGVFPIQREAFSIERPCPRGFAVLTRHIA